MKIYKELKFAGDKTALDKLYMDIYRYYPSGWTKPEDNGLLRNYILADYVGSGLPHAEVSIYCGADSCRQGYVKVVNIVPLDSGTVIAPTVNKL